MGSLSKPTVGQRYTPIFNFWAGSACRFPPSDTLRFTELRFMDSLTQLLEIRVIAQAIEIAFR
jgi:hypothetical protein